jgi:hypothetical protein
MQRVCASVSDKPAISILRVYNFKNTGCHIPADSNLNALCVLDEIYQNEK